MRLGDVIEKTQSELNTSKIQLSQIQRQEAQSRQELDSIRSLTNNKDKRGKELQVYKYFGRLMTYESRDCKSLRNNDVVVIVISATVSQYSLYFIGGHRSE